MNKLRKVPISTPMVELVLLGVSFVDNTKEDFFLGADGKTYSYVRTEGWYEIHVSRGRICTYRNNIYRVVDSKLEVIVDIWNHPFASKEEIEAMLPENGENPRSINCIKQIRTSRGCGLKDAKDFYDHFIRGEEWRGSEEIE